MIHGKIMDNRAMEAIMILVREFFIIQLISFNTKMNWAFRFHPRKIDAWNYLAG